ncbi:hypothetical protein CUU63_10250 [Bacillus halotolerans]|uniref:Uncharacterized protein n=1 Tax=Bacillus halotolerans TaxID=260554 RepID=A0A9Q6F249_9BACI|nr:hypothetical protein CUU63_10250 [Bacillus halotolerans]
MECTKCREHIGGIVFYIRITDEKEYKEFPVHKECGEELQKKCLEHCRDMKLEKTLIFLKLYLE